MSKAIVTSILAIAMAASAVDQFAVAAAASNTEQASATLHTDSVLQRPSFAMEGVYQRLSAIERRSSIGVAENQDILNRLEALENRWKVPAGEDGFSQRLARVEKVCNDVCKEQAASNQIVADHLSKLETHFLKQSFPKDEITTRLTRLEKSVLGSEKSGSIKHRLDALLICM